MSRFCTNCGATLEDDALFCPECGTRTEDPVSSDIFPENAADKTPGQAEPPIQEMPEPPVPPLQPAPDPAAESTAGRSKEISTAGYFWLMLLYHIPVIGFIFMLIFGLSAENRNLRNYARAHLVWIIVMILVLVLFYIVTRILLKAAGIVIDWETLFQNIRSIIPIN